MKTLLTIVACALVHILASRGAAAAPILSVSSVRSTGTAGLRDLGPAPAAMRMDLTIVLPYRDARELSTLITAQSDPRSPIFGKYLTAQQFAQSFAPATADYAQVAIALRRRGFTIVRRYADRTLIDVAAPVAVVQTTFSTTIHRVLQPGLGYRYAAVSRATLPADLQRLTTVIGLDNLGSARAPRLPLPTLLPDVGVSAPSTLIGPDQGYSAAAVAIANDYPLEHGFDGSGLRVADIQNSIVLDQSVATYFQRFGLKRTGPSTQVVAVDGGCQCKDELGTVDAEQIVGTAPGVALTMFQIPLPSTSLNFLHALQQTVESNIDVVNLPWGFCELDDPTWDKALYNIAQHGTALGMTFLGVSFHAGLACFNRPTPTIDTPADDPLFTAVGGSFLHTDGLGRYRSEMASGGTGGGVSSIFELPAYQAQVPGVLTSGRNTPDIVAPTRINGLNVSEYFAPPGCTPDFGALCGWIGGIRTRPFINSAPIAGLIAEIDAVRGGRSGLLNAELYNTWLRLGDRTSQGAPLFHDLTQGCIVLGDSPLYCAHRGYDHVSGIGSIDGWNFARALR